jgi:hypothetical protein
MEYWGKNHSAQTKDARRKTESAKGNERERTMHDTLWNESLDVKCICLQTLHRAPGEALFTQDEKKDDQQERETLQVGRKSAVHRKKQLHDAKQRARAKKKNRE